MSPNLDNKASHVFKSPKCGARTRAGFTCPNFAQQNGRCRRHGGLSTGPKTELGKARVSMNAIRDGYYSVEAMEERRSFKEALEQYSVTLKELREYLG